MLRVALSYKKIIIIINVTCEGKNDTSAPEVCLDVVATSPSPTPGPFEVSFAVEQASCPRMVLVEDSGCKWVSSCLAGMSP